MKVIVAGSRSVVDFAPVAMAIARSGFGITQLVSGVARGVDTIGERWAHGKRVPVVRFPAGWRDRDGCVDRRAGFARNVRMAEYADALVAVWDGESPGTKHMIETARHYGLEVYVAMIGENGQLMPEGEHGVR